MSRESHTLPETIILMGMKHCGKSTLGRKLSRRYSCRFYDLDDLILTFDHPGIVSSARDIYRDFGKEYFTESETRAARELARMLESEGTAVVSLGGGTIENEGAMQALEHSGIFIYLEYPPEILFERIIAGGLPPFLSPEHPREDFLELYGRRTPLYAERADLTLKLGEHSLEAAADILEHSLKEYIHAR